jgi:alpha-galactosidase
LYNATAVSYETGLGDQNELLLGSVVGTVAPMGTVEAMVESHSVGMFRLRAQPERKRKRDEL